MSEYSKKITILYVEDEVNVREGYKRALLRHAKEVYIASNGKEGLELYKKYLPDLIISDINMPLLNGLEMVEEIKKLNQNIKVIFTTAHSESAYLLEAISLQIESYLLKPVQKKELNAMVEKIAKSISLEKENETLRLELSKMAYKDNLTGVYNRNKFEEFFEYEFKKSKRYDLPLSIAILDIDNFKKFNDNHGHIIGDEILILIAKAIEKSVRETDLFARWGGEEFVILFNSTTQEGALKKSNAIREFVSNLEHPTAGNVTISIGVAELMEKDTLESLFKKADKALYIAKSTGRNCVVGT